MLLIPAADGEAQPLACGRVGVGVPAPQLYLQVLPGGTTTSTVVVAYGAIVLRVQL